VDEETRIVEVPMSKAGSRRGRVMATVKNNVRVRAAVCSYYGLEEEAKDELYGAP
jgi:hypothetical protein